MSNVLVSSGGTTLKAQVGGGYGGKSNAFPSTLTYVGAAKMRSNKPTGTNELMGSRKVYMIHDAAANSFFISGGSSIGDSSNTLYLGEFAMPTFTNTTDYDALTAASATIEQNFVNILDASSTGNLENHDRITGGYVDGSKIILNSNDWYDAATDNFNTTLVIQDKTDLAGSVVKGYYDGDFKAKGAGWVTDIPAAMQTALGGDVIFGYAHNDSISSRSSLGPTAYGVTLADVSSHAGSSGTFTSNTLMEFPAPLTMGGVDVTIANDIWTKMSRSRCGFIVPGTTKYVVVGASGGHEFGLTYKGINDAGELAPGWATDIKADNYNYYWVFDTDDLAAVKAGSMNAEDVFPIERGELTLPFMEVTDATYQPLGFSILNGAAFDPVTSALYLLLSRVNPLDRVILKYTVGT